MNRVNQSDVIVIVTIFAVCFVSSATAGQQQSWQSASTIQKFAPVNKCSSSQREAMFRCENKAKDSWNVRDTDYYTSTRKFCCFVWDTLSCQLDIAQRCDPSYATSLSQITEQTYSSMCDNYSRGSVSCALP